MGFISKFKDFRSSNGKDKKGEKKEETTEKEMSFLEHLEELRWHLD